MKKVTERAVRTSIRHWKRGATKKEAVGNATDCALCERFNSPCDPTCVRDDGEKCPVFASTGQTLCNGSPYELWVYETPSAHRFARTKHDIIKINAEVLFLQSLLP